MQKECKNWDWNEKSASFDILYKVIGEAWEEERKWENKNEIENSEWKHEDVKEKKRKELVKENWVGKEIIWNKKKTRENLGNIKMAGFKFKRKQRNSMGIGKVWKEWEKEWRHKENEREIRIREG